MCYFSDRMLKNCFKIVYGVVILLKHGIQLLYHIQIDLGFIDKS